MSACQDWAHPRTAAQFIGYIQEGPNPAGLIVRLVTHNAIPTTAEECGSMKSKRIVGTVLGFPKLGFVSAPYAKKAKAGKEPPAQPKRLLESLTTNQYGEVTSVKVFSFHKANSNYDKGPRDEDCTSVINIGQTLTFYINEFMFDTKEKAVFPEGIEGPIPAYSVIEVQLNPSHNQSKGYGMKIAKIAPQSYSLYSYLGTENLNALIRTPEYALALNKEWARQCEPIANLVEQSRIAFVCQIHNTARVVDVGDGTLFLRVECQVGGQDTPAPGVHCIDMSVSDLLKFTNCPDDILQARTLVDLAIASGALKMLVTFDDYYNKQDATLSQYRGVPLIDCGQFLSNVQESLLQTSDLSVIFPTHWKVNHDPNLQSVALRVWTIPSSNLEEDEEHEVLHKVPCPDMPLIHSSCAFDKAYRVVVGNPGSGTEDGEDAFYVLKMYFNIAQKCALGAKGRTTGYKRLRMED